MHKTTYTEKPAPILIDRMRGMIHYTIALNAVQQDDGSWRADTRSFWLSERELDPNVVALAPEVYFWYDKKKEYTTAAQALVDRLRSSRPVVPVPSFREGAAICHAPEDDTKLLAGVIMGGLPVFELASGELTTLTVDDIKAMMQDVAGWEYTVQDAKQRAWKRIKAAECEHDMADAVEELKYELAALEA